MLLYIPCPVSKVGPGQGVLLNCSGGQGPVPQGHLVLKFVGKGTTTLLTLVYWFTQMFVLAVYFAFSRR